MIQNARFSVPGDHRLRVYVMAILVGGAAAIGLGGFFGGSSGDVTLVTGLFIAGAASERFKVRLFGDSHVSCSSFAIMAAALLGGARDGVLVAAMLGLAVNLGGRLPAYKSLFNVATYVLSMFAFIGVLKLANHATGTYRIIPLTVASLGHFLTNSLLVATAAAIASGRSLPSVFREKYAWLAPHYAPLGALLYLTSVTFAAIGWHTVLLLALPVAGIQISMVLYAALKRSFTDYIRLSSEHISDVEAKIQQVELELARVSVADGKPGQAA